jgi:GTP-binding protein HflX
MDRRRIRARISRLSGDLEEIHQRRGVARRKREEEEVPTVALVGYTNVGKSTLLNRLTQAGAAAEERLFTTLDPLARRFKLPNRQPILLSDTVGFLHRLPHHLIEAFRATLEEVTECHLILHLLDGSHPMLKEQEEAVHEVLESLDAQGKPMVVALNKLDRLEPTTRDSLRRRYPGAVFISALTGEGIPDLIERLMSVLSHQMRYCSVRIPLREQRWMERIYAQGQVLRRQTVDDHLLLEIRVPHRLYGQLEKAGLLTVSP